MCCVKKIEGQGYKGRWIEPILDRDTKEDV